MSDHVLGLLMTQTWQITALAIVVAVVVKLVAKNRPHLAHALWVLVLIKCVTPPLWEHSLGVFSQLQARMMPDETAFLLDANGSPASVPVATAEPLVTTLEVDVPDPEHGQPEIYKPDELLSLADTEPPEDASLMWDGGTGIKHDEAIQTLDEPESNLTHAEPELPVDNVESNAGWPRPGWLLLSGLVAGAMMTMFVMVIRCLRCLRLIHRHRTSEFDDPLRERVRHLARQLRVRRIPQIIVSDVLFGPAVLGLLRHTIVLPRCLFETAEGSPGRSFLPERTFAERRTASGPTSAPRQSIVIDSISSGRVAAGREVLPGREDLLYLDPILAHELLHIRRGDLRTGTLQAISQSLWWFHPAVWLSNRWLSREAERCCDEQVIAELGCSPAQYARSLLSVIECKHQLQPIPVFPGMKPVEITTQRMERIMSLRSGLKKQTPLWCWLIVVALALVVLPGAVATPAPDEPAAHVGQASGLPTTPASGSVSKHQDANTTDDKISTSTASNELIADERIQSTEMARPVPAFVLNSTDPLVKLVWDAREASRRRLLMTDQRTPWQVMNGLMALRRDFVLRDGEEVANGLEWVQGGPKIPSDPWFQKTEHGGQPDPDPAPLWFDDHTQAFLAALAMSDVPMDAKFATPDGPITMGDMIRHLQMTVSTKNLSPWTLCALSKRLSPDAKWVNADNEEWSVEKLLQIEVDKPDQVIQPMVLLAIACARNQYLKTGQSLRGVWQQADQEIHTVIQQEESDWPGYRTLVVPRRYPHMKGATRLPRFPPVSPVDPGSQARLFREAVRIHPYQAPYFDTFSDVPKGPMLLFFITALPDEQLQATWLRNAVEAAAIELLADWANAGIRSPFYETTQALSIYLERIAVAGAKSNVDQTAPLTVRVKGQVRNPGVYQASTGDNLRLMDAIGFAGGVTDEAEKTVYVLRNLRNNPRSMLLQIGYNGPERGAEPNIFLAPGDEVLLQSPEFVKTPLADSIRLDDSFVMSPDMPMTGSSVIAYVNDRPITVENFVGPEWSTLEKTHGITEELKRRIALESIASGLPEFVYQEMILQYFHADLPGARQEKSQQQREVTDKRFAEALANPSGTDEDARRLAQQLGVILARRSESEILLRRNKVDEYVRGLHHNSIASKKSAVVRHVQELVTTARLRSVVSLDFTNASLAEVVRSINKVHAIGIEVNSLHANVSTRIFDKPTAIEFSCQNKPLGEAIKDLFEPFGLKLILDGDSALLQFADSQQAMEQFQSLPGPPSFGLFGIVQNNGWHPLETEIRLLDALGIAGRVENPEGVTIEITNPDIIVGNAIPVSMSLGVLQNDESGKLNRIVKDGDIISVTWNGCADAFPVKLSGAGVINGKVINSDAGLVAIARFDQRSNGADDENSASTSEVQEQVSRRSGRRPTPERIRELRLESAVADVKPDAKEVSHAERLILVTYPVADLVFRHQSVVSAVGRSTDSDVDAPVGPATALTSRTAAAPDQIVDLPDVGRQARALTYRADLTPLVELIKASVQPDSWHERRTVAVDETTLSLVIRQSPVAHHEISELLSQLREAQDQSVQIPCLVVRLTKESQTMWLEEQCSLNSLEHGSRWALLPQQRCESFTQALLEQKPEVVSRPRVITISGQTATITVGQSAVSGTPTIGIRLEVTPHVLPYSNVIRLQHSFSVGDFANEMPRPTESLVGSGQTLLLLVDDPEDNEKPAAARSQYLLMMTPEHIPQKEEEEEISTASPEDSALAVESAESPDK